MRILHVSDFHFRADWFHWLATEAKSYDACCLTGDLLDLFVSDRIGLQQQVRWVQDWLRSFPGQLFTCSGNHDWWPAPPDVIDPHADGRWLREARSGRVHVDGDVAARGNYAFACKPWIGAIDRLTDDQPIVLLTHEPPADLASAPTDALDEVGPLMRRLPEGSIVLSGHVHYPRCWHEQIGAATCFNPGWNGQAVPNHIAIDLARREARFRGWEREESFSF